MLYDKRWDLKSDLAPWQKVLLEAAKVIESKGWCQGDYTRDGAYCAIGAIDRAANILVLKDEGLASVEAAGFLSFSLGHGVLGEGTADEAIAKWNDCPWRTKEEVVTKLREVASFPRETE